MSEERVTIRQLAKLSGVSIGTVSRALNGYADVSPETRERIMRLAQRARLHARRRGAQPRTQRSHVIGVFLETGEGHPDLQHPFFHEVLVGLKDPIGAGGYDLLLFASERPGNGYGTHSYLKRCRHHNVEGVVLMGVDPDDAEVRRLVRSDLPGRGRRRARGPGDELRDVRQRRRRGPRCARTSTSSGTAASRRSPACSRRARARPPARLPRTRCRTCGLAFRDEYVAYGDFYVESGRACDGRAAGA